MIEEERVKVFFLTVKRTGNEKKEWGKGSPKKDLRANQRENNELGLPQPGRETRLNKKGREVNKEAASFNHLFLTLRAPEREKR